MGSFVSIPSLRRTDGFNALAGLQFGKAGFSSSPTEPICTMGPYRPMRAVTGLPLSGSVPSCLSPTAPDRGFQRMLHTVMKGIVEFPDHIVPIPVARRLNLVKFLFNIGGEGIVHHLVEMLVQKIRYHQSQVGREEFGFFSPVFSSSVTLLDLSSFRPHDPEFTFHGILIFLLHVIPFDDGGRWWGIGTGAPDAEFFQFLPGRLPYNARHVW